jgi:hypothetical protein
MPLVAGGVPEPDVLLGPLPHLGVITPLVSIIVMRYSMGY